MHHSPQANPVKCVPTPTSIRPSMQNPTNECHPILPPLLLALITRHQHLLSLHSSLEPTCGYSDNSILMPSTIHYLAPTIQHPNSYNYLTYDEVFRLINFRAYTYYSKRDQPARDNADQVESISRLTCVELLQDMIVRLSRQFKIRSVRGYRLLACLYTQMLLR